MPHSIDHPHLRLWNIVGHILAAGQLNQRVVAAMDDDARAGDRSQE